MQALTQVDGGVVGGQAVGLSPQVKSIAGAAALEAVEDVLFQVGREAAAGAGGGPM